MGKAGDSRQKGLRPTGSARWLVPLGWLSLILGYGILLLPGPLGWPGIPFMVGGLVLILRGSIGAKRFFLRLVKQNPKSTGWLRRMVQWHPKRRNRRNTAAPSNSVSKP